MSTAPAARVRVLAREVRAHLVGHDLLLYAAGVTFYAGIAVLPILLLALALAAALVGAERVHELGEAAAGLLPSTLGADRVAVALVRSGTQLSWPTIAACVFPATLYGEGLLRAFDRFASERPLSAAGIAKPAIRGRLSRGWRGRLLTLPALVLAPAALIVVLFLIGWIRDQLSTGAGDTVLGIYLSFLTTWVLVSLMLALAYRLLARRRPNVSALLWGSFGTGSFIAGFLLGYVLFLALDVPIGRPFGGFRPVGLAVATGLWGFVLHLLVLVGYVVTLRLAAGIGKAPPAGAAPRVPVTGALHG